MNIIFENHYTNIILSVPSSDKNKWDADEKDAFKRGELRSYVNVDFKTNGNKDLVLACESINNNIAFTTNGNKSYLFVLSKSKNNYKLVKTFEFNTYEIFIVTEKSDKNKIMIGFQYETDWVNFVSWNGKDYISIEPVE